MVVEGGGGSRPTTAAADGADGAADEALEAHECPAHECPEREWEAGLLLLAESLALHCTTYAAQASNPRPADPRLADIRLADPRQACYSHVRALPWAGALPPNPNPNPNSDPDPDHNPAPHQAHLLRDRRLHAGRGAQPTRQEERLHRPRVHRPRPLARAPRPASCGDARRGGSVAYSGFSLVWRSTRHLAPGTRTPIE
eukprot:scaffold73107_cov54-Phaeocystis_antarctica.AAC.3